MLFGCVIIIFILLFTTQWAWRAEAIATFGRADVAGKAMKFALGDDHGIVITTPADFPDPAPEAGWSGQCKKQWTFSRMRL